MPLPARKHVARARFTHAMAEATHSEETKQAFTAPILAIVALGVAARVCAMLLFRDDLSRDRDAYLALAEGILRSGTLADPETALPTAFRPPLYPMVLAPWAALFGRAWGVALLHLTAGGVSVWLAHRLAQRLFGPVRPVPGVPLLAGDWCALLVAVDPLLLRYAAQPMTETLATTLFLGALVAIADTWTGRVPQAAPLGATTAGMMAGTCVLCRPVFAAVWPMTVLFAGIWAKAMVRRRGCRNPLRRHRSDEDARLDDGTHARSDADERPSPGERTDALKQLARFGFLWATGGFLVLLPWVVRNALRLGRPVVLTTHGGYTLYLANNPWFYRKVVQGRWTDVLTAKDIAALQSHANRVIRQRHPHGADELERDRVYYELAWESIRGSPGLFLKACAVRVARLWNVVPLVAPRATKWARLAVAIVGVFYALQLAAALWGFGEVAVRLFGFRNPVPGANDRNFPPRTSRLTVEPSEKSSEPPSAGRRLPATAQPPDAPGELSATPSGTLMQERLAWTLPRLLVWCACVASVVAFTLVHGVYWSNARMRAPLVPVIACLAIEPLVRRQAQRRG
ncbi:MAG: hypothetical protein D6725_00685 [Planctomycetota bacterium]|nr:MAG: hypothetical protein D6725_00685 [Planctomycetota bacterium]